MGRKLGATPCFGKAAEHSIIVVSGGLYVHLAEASAGPVLAIGLDLTIKSPGSRPGFSKIDADRSGGRLVELGSRGLDRLDGFGRNLLAEFGELLGLGRKGLELLAGL